MSANLNHISAALRVCVDAAQAGHISGRVFSQRLTRPVEFSDSGSLLLQLEQVLDAQNFPQAFQRTRSFRPVQGREVPAALSPGEGMSAETVSAAHGAVSTFLIFVITRQNTTWQGFVDWLDGSEREPYSSVLELLRQIDQHVPPAK